MQVGPKQFDMRFWDQKGGAFDIEATLVMHVAAGPPSTWQLCPMEGESGAGVHVTQDAGWTVKCGQEFTVALELSDEFGNKCESCLHRVLSFSVTFTMINAEATSQLQAEHAALMEV